MAWLALSLEVEAAAADWGRDAMLEAGALSTSIEDPQAERCRVSALLDERADAAAFVSSLFQDPPPYQVSQVEDADWVRKSQAQFSPLQVGERLWVGPTWCEPPSGVPAVVRLDPGMAFGTGSHPSTRLVLKFLEEHVRGGERVLDYGCGSGILAIAAARLGAAFVAASDNDPQAVDTTRANARANGVNVFAALPDDLPQADYDVVVSNILAQPLIDLAPRLGPRAVRIALTGILASQADEVARAYAPWCALQVTGTDEDWVLLSGVRA